LELTVRYAVRPPAAAGVNTTEIAQLAPGAMLVQEWPGVKSPSVLAMDAIERFAFPVLVTVCRDGLVAAPTVCGGKSRPLAAKAMAGVAGGTPVPTGPALGLPHARCDHQSPGYVIAELG
jgi:hypothetical protein